MRMTTTEMSGLTLGASLEKLARNGIGLGHVLTVASSHVQVEGTGAVAHCHHVALDGSGLPRLQDFTNAIADWLVDYVIPRRALIEATSVDPHETRIKMARLRRSALDTFKRHGMSGEQGEMLLFVLAETVLGLPQLLCKMDLKTDSEMHFHGLDGVHCGPGVTADQLAVYWCESKVHKDLDGALSEALDGLKPFLISAGAGGADKRRELALLDRYMDLGDPTLQKQLLDALDPHSEAFNKVVWRGLCLIGFDHIYPIAPNAVTAEAFTTEVQSTFPNWAKKVTERVKNRKLETFEIHFFYVPLGLCDDFREAMKVSLELKT